MILGAAGAWYAVRRRRASQRERLLAAPLPAEWERLLERRVPLYRRVPGEHRAELNGLINVFVHDKRFIGCNGLEVTDEMRAVIAAQACILLLNRNTGCYPGFRTIYVYPGTYLAHETRSEGLLETEETDARAGESWHRGPVVLSWDDILAGLEAPDDAFNVVLHEFAHKLDEENDASDGLPILHDPSQYRTWAQVLGKEFEALRARAARDEPGVIDEYGAESPAEFFAVATEAFFERPQALRRHHPALYEELSRFYRLDPGTWHAG
ncbi:MAG: zinc-dependent peptidase [Gammaproteobacteria bacterium]|nr:zinc-dependent peptidase [Gammaproteobacteria bacterium]